MLKRLLTICACVALCTNLARADDDPQPDHGYEPKPGWAMLAGAGTAIVPMAIAGPFFANTFDVSERRGATLGILSGLTLAPIVSHLVVHEWSRAAIFGAIPFACLLGEVILLEVQPSADVFGTPQGRLSFGLLLSFATLSSGIGIIDTLGAKHRSDAREQKRAANHASILALPFAMSGGGGLTAGGTF